MRSAADGASLLRAGADKVSVNTAALARPALISELASLLGSQAVVVAIDAAGGEVYTRAGTEPTGRGVRSTGPSRRRSAAPARSC